MAHKLHILLCSCLVLACTNVLAANNDSVAQFSWLRSMIIPILSVEMNSSNKDLRALKKLTANTKVIALGEVTHGSREIYQMKDKMVKYLVEHEGFNVFAIEAPMPEAYKLNEYITGGKGKPEALIKGMHFRIWETKEVLDLVNWMKVYNDTHLKKIVFTGIDMGYYEGAFEEINRICTKYTKNCDALLNSLLQNITGLDRYRRKQLGKNAVETVWPDATQIKEACFELRKFASNYITGVNERDWFIENLAILEQFNEQFALHPSANYRDSCMAENLLWIYRHYPGSKFIIWAHNEHICRNNNPFQTNMGYYLDKALGHNYLPIGFTFHSGSFTSGGKGLYTGTATTSHPGTYEYIFHSVGQPFFMLDMRKITARSNWPGYMLFRVTGVKETGNEFWMKNIKKAFDIIVFIDRSTNSTLLR